MKFKNVYFINGTAYAGKSTMVKLLAENMEKYGLEVLPDIAVELHFEPESWRDNAEGKRLDNLKKASYVDC